MKFHDEADLPTISLCIPARNETYVLEECLKNVIASEYPKLEIIVLDDCSQDKTSQVIKSFAHEGVRFVQGEVPSDGWLGKNNAYQALSQEAQGTYLVFMSVDTRVDKEALLGLVHYMQLKKLSMVSVLPQRKDKFKISTLFSPLRYFWQVITPLWLNTPTASSLWVIRHDTLESLGGFSVIKDDILPENSLAKLLKSEHRYQFIVAKQQIGVYYAKKWSSQIDTGVRLWYPSLGKKLHNVILMVLLHICLFVLPYIALIYFMILSHSILLAVTAFSVVIVVAAIYTRYTYRVQHTTWLLAPIMLPILAVQEIAIIISSYVQYTRGKVDWKGRNICYPAANHVKH